MFGNDGCRSEEEEASQPQLTRGRWWWWWPWWCKDGGGGGGRGGGGGGRGIGDLRLDRSIISTGPKVTSIPWPPGQF
jgi:hypothetical protein